MEGSFKKKKCFVFGCKYKESLTFKTLQFKPTTPFGNKKNASIKHLSVKTVIYGLKQICAKNIKP